MQHNRNVRPLEDQMIRLEGQGHKLEVAALRRSLYDDGGAPYNDWFTCLATLRSTSCFGDFRFQLMRVDFVRFRDELAALLEKPLPGMQARLCGIEPGIDLSLLVCSEGKVLGQYDLVDFDRTGADAPMVSGEIETRVEALGLLIRGVDTILAMGDKP